MNTPKNAKRNVIDKAKFFLDKSRIAFTAITSNAIKANRPTTPVLPKMEKNIE